VWQLSEVVQVLFGEFILKALQVKEKKTTTTKRRKKLELIMRDYV
jgi:parvulin-like peptidyl-prolyl isomerase